MRFRYFLYAFIFCALYEHVETTMAMPLATDDVVGCEVAYVSDDAIGTSEYHVPARISPPVPSPLDFTEQIALGNQSYEDVFGILKEENPCSRFFGGPARAVEVFNAFARRLKKKSFSSRAIAVRMSGRFGMYRNNLTGVEYRLFDEAALNTNGPLARHGHRRNDGKVTTVGSYYADTRSARALVFLHELGHLIPGVSGGWILPNDGDDFAVSERNTKMVESKCRQQLSALR